MADHKLSVDKLSLSLAGIDSPFALVGTENNFGPDDWAWQFLRLNQSYQRDYANALAAHDPDDDHPSGAFTFGGKHPERKIRASERYCRKLYGLSTWLDPQNVRLPFLNLGESWFFPLTLCWDSPVAQELPDAIQSLFAYAAPTLPIGVLKNRSELASSNPRNLPQSVVWFAVDCSVLSTAQLQSVELVTGMYRDYLRKIGAAVHGGYDREAGFVPLNESPWFDAKTFDSASAIADGVDPSSVWYVIRIDVLGPVQEQLDAHRRRLAATYVDLVKSGKTIEPVRERFRKELKGPRDEDRKLLSDGYFLKALVICAQLSQDKLDEFEIVEFIHRHAEKSDKESPKPGSVRDNWSVNFAVRAANYREHARAFVRGGYRWLVHAQKP